MPKVDLHIHSSVSDGLFSPTEVVRQAVEAGLTTISLTDHDNVDGVASALEAAGSYPSLKVIPGVEISTDVPEGEVHDFYRVFRRRSVLVIVHFGHFDLVLITHDPVLLFTYMFEDGLFIRVWSLERPSSASGFASASWTAAR